MNFKKWILSATILGLSFFVSILLVKPIGVSTQFSVATGIIYSAIDSNLIQKDPDRESGYKSSNAYYDKSEGKLAKEIKNPINYDFIFVLSIPLGATIGYITKRNKKENNYHTKPIFQNVQTHGFIRRYAPTFIGGFLLLYGARMAGGCTSGHMMSGMMQSSVSGYVFAMVVFIVAIPVAILTRKFTSNN